MAWQWLFNRALPRNGAAATLETPGTGIPPALLDAAVEEAPPEPQTTRRDRAPGGAEDVLLETIAQKVLHGWLQNRHQTLAPLTLNFRALNERQREVLAQMMAVALLAGHSHSATMEEVPPRIREWLASIGADSATLTALDRALADPPSLSAALDAVADQDVAVYAYVVGLVSSDSGNLASLRFLDYLEARLGLPTAVMRSAARRYRR